MAIRMLPACSIRSYRSDGHGRRTVEQAAGDRRQPDGAGGHDGGHQQQVGRATAATGTGQASTSGERRIRDRHAEAQLLAELVAEGGPEGGVGRERPIGDLQQPVQAFVGHPMPPGYALRMRSRARISSDSVAASLRPIRWATSRTV